MRAWQLKEFSGPQGLVLADLPDAAPGPGEVQIRIKAISLNFRDLAMVRGAYGSGIKAPLIPCSDCAGEVTAVGPGVTRVKPGDRVTPTFFQDWLYGDVRRRNAASALGGGGKGVLAEQIVLHESGMLPVPAHLSLEEAACLPCAGLTAWHALMERGAVQAGDSVLIQGTGGVSIFALQFAMLEGARVFAISSSDDKRKRLEAMGVVGSVNYKTAPNWDEEIPKLNGGQGMDWVIEVGGAGTLARSLGAIRPGGRIQVIGVLSGPAEMNPQPILRKQAHIQGISVGSREMFENMNAAIVRAALNPVIDRVFKFADTVAAFNHLAAGAHFGKVVIQVG
jgi:NADPH:quinone reductase-like Zn-dependent oxidoreductase